ncbi:spondin domain-containing protein [Formosa sp. PL04]|uniref:spondin domain-containing protein n=1 Tax=Formosa sp. PL04 TaxID=3081755 RepID=UPI002980C709|nr:spondin domain-containing protein [Formosa sp. PL04]MDW5290948.1 spondin domain-containing protein [Formosa sp. PL04]
MKKLVLGVALFGLVGISCSSDDDNSNVNTTADGSFTVTIENIAPINAFLKSGVFNTPTGDSSPGPATPGKKYEFIIDAGRSQSLSFVTMLAATNDAFFAPGSEGIALYDENGDPITANVTDQVYLWDAGTEVNEEPAVGPNTVTNQSGPNTGVVENGNVLLMSNVTNGEAFDFPEVNEIINVSVTYMEGTQFLISIEDLADATLSTSLGDKVAPLSPGVYVVHGGTNPLFTEGEPDLGQGIEAIAEDGNVTNLGAYTAENTGVTYPASPGVWVVHKDQSNPLFTEGAVDYGNGLEAIAEDGNTAVLGANIISLSGVTEGAIMNTPVGSSSPGPILPGDSYKFTFDAKIGDNLSFVNMLAATNDVFIGTSDEGIALFNASGEAVNGDITNSIYLWDAGTEVNEEPAIGPNTVTNQLGSDTGIEENNDVKLLSNVKDGFTYPAVNSIFKVTITTN